MGVNTGGCRNNKLDGIMFPCSNGRCIHESLVCDLHSFNNCGDHSDEGIFCRDNVDGWKTKYINDLNANQLHKTDIVNFSTPLLTIASQCTL